MQTVVARSFLAAFIPLAKRYSETNQDIGVVLVEIDNLANIFKEEGETVGEACQNEVASMLKSLAKRSDDIVGVVDDSRFAVALTNTGYEVVKQIVADFMLGFFGDELSVSVGGKRKRVDAKVCAGVAVHQSSEDGFSTLETAYRALRDAQSNSYSSFSCLERSQGGGFLNILARQFKSGGDSTSMMDIDGPTGFPASKEFERILVDALHSAENSSDCLSVVEINLQSGSEGASNTNDDGLIAALGEGLCASVRSGCDRFCRTGPRGVSVLLSKTDQDALQSILIRFEKVLNRLAASPLFVSQDQLTLSTFTHNPGEPLAAFSETVLGHLGMERQLQAI